MSPMLADDPTAGAVLAAMPCFPVPPHGRSPAIDGLHSARTSAGLAIGRDGVMYILRRPWLALDVAVASSMAGYLPYGSIGMPRADLRCGLIPRCHLRSVIDHFRASLPDEAAAFLFWNEATGAFAVQYPIIEHASPSRLIYRMPVMPPHWHMVCDIHSHGHRHAFFSATDDADDAHATKIAIVLGRLDRSEGPMMVSRLCAAGMFLPLPSGPFSGGSDDD